MSKNQVNDILGTPMIQDGFNPHRWDYVYYYRSRSGEEERKRATVVFENNRVALITRGDVPQQTATMASDDAAPTAAPAFTQPIDKAAMAKAVADKASMGKDAVDTAVDKAMNKVDESIPAQPTSLSIPVDGSDAEIVRQPKAPPKPNTPSAIAQPEPVPQIVVPLPEGDAEADLKLPAVTPAKAMPAKKRRSSFDIINSDEAEPEVKVPLSEDQSSDIVFNPKNAAPPKPKAPPAPAPKVVPEQANDLQVGMSKTDVLQVLGVPPKGSEMQGNVWNYKARDRSGKKLKLTFKDGKLARIDRSE